MSLLFPKTIPPTCDKKWFPRSELSQSSLEPCASLFLSNQARAGQNGQQEKKKEKVGKTEVELLEEEEKAFEESLDSITLLSSHPPIGITSLAPSPPPPTPQESASSSSNSEEEEEEEESNSESDATEEDDSDNLGEGMMEESGDISVDMEQDSE
ncbi:hypothetical protein TL16_g01790 [Triparma laevis f. inornata]|uniref:Uncharacterized protein n=1 Tax=Triparma laevis f. inornata TaxID=1714386 RepID=A0A9W7DY54_9STRA|nr:hypothetical protein TL16_g01790 [Triparma laevis f. inornata]